MLCILRWGWQKSLLLAYFLAVAGMLGGRIAQRLFGSEQDYTLTLMFIPMFVVGALLAQHRVKWISWFQTYSSTGKAMLIGIALMLYTYHWWAFPNIKWLHVYVIDRGIVTIGVSIFLIAALASARIGKLLLARPLLAIGKASYSIYLLHAIFLFGLIQMFYQKMPLWIIFVFALFLTAVASYFSYRFIELPSIKLGRNLARQWQNRLQTRA